MEDSLSFYAMSHESLVFTTITIHPYLFLKKINAMTTIKAKFRPSKINGKKGAVYYLITSNRKQRQVPSTHKATAEEWDSGCQWLESELRLLRRVTQSLSDKNFTIDEIAEECRRQMSRQSLESFFMDEIQRQQQLSRYRTAEAYQSTLHYIVRWHGGDAMLNDVDNHFVQEFESDMKKRGLAMNTISFYLRNFRAVYNRAVEKGLTPQRSPFRHTYTGVAKTVKRAISLTEIKQIAKLALDDGSVEAFARDMFLFSFYMRGMSPIDMANLKADNVRNGLLTYRRQKTGQQLSIRWENCMQQIVDRYSSLSDGYLLPILRPCKSKFKYKNEMLKINGALKRIGQKIGLSHPLTMYVARHSWASIARSKNVPISVISEGMGHNSERTTQIYLASIDRSQIDNANVSIINDLLSN